MIKQNLFFQEAQNENYEFIESISSKNILLITSTGHKKRGLFTEYLLKLKNNNNKIETFFLDKYPEISDIKSVIKGFEEPNFIISFGGGSCIDLAKILSVQFSNNKISHLAIPTTSGSGAESTSFATIWDIQNQKKLSIEDSNMLPNYVYLNPIFCTTMPEKLTISTCLDSISHCVDSILSKKVSSESLNLCKSSIDLVIENIEGSLQNPSNVKLRGEVLKASNLSGKAINLTKTSLTHSISYPLTYKYEIEHGFACGFSLKEVIKIYYDELKKVIEASKVDKIIALIDKFDIKIYIHEQLQSIDFEDFGNQIMKNNRLENFFINLSKEELLNIIGKSYKEYS